jgi:hypothetical protein
VEHLLSLVPLETRLEFVPTRVPEEEVQDLDKVPSSSGGTRLEVPDLESSISGHLSGEDEATELSAQLVDDYAWVDKNWQKTGWRNPEAAKWKAGQDPDGFAKERRAYEAGWRAAERTKTGAAKLGSDNRACENWGEIVSKWIIVEHKRTCGGSAP